jgi:hypothetical protein
MTELVSNCCSAYPASQEDIEGEICPKCFEHCEYVETEDPQEEYAKEVMRETINKYR